MPPKFYKKVKFSENLKSLKIIFTETQISQKILLDPNEKVILPLPQDIIIENSTRKN